jgi:hypothetical protein
MMLEGVRTDGTGVMVLDGVGVVCLDGDGESNVRLAGGDGPRSLGIVRGLSGIEASETEYKLACLESDTGGGTSSWKLGVTESSYSDAVGVLLSGSGGYSVATEEGAEGTEGAEGVDETDGVDGSDGADGSDGGNGGHGGDGIEGVDRTDGAERDEGAD